MGGMPCKHGLNPQACLPCFHEKRNAAPTSKPAERASVPKNNVIDAVKQARLDAQQAEGAVNIRLRAAGLPNLPPGTDVLEPTVHVGPTRVGYENDGTPIAQPKQEDPELGRPKVRGKMPVPVLHGGAVAGQAQKTLEPFSYASAKPWHTKTVTVAGVQQTIAVPPRHGSIIDSLPRHPNPEPALRR